MYLYKVSIGNLGTIKFITAGCPPRWEIVRGQKDEFFLAEHHLYGSSRLGTKGYWQKEYNLKYIPGDAAHNQANLDASAFNYRRPWYSKVYNAMIEMQHTRPYGNEHTEQLYSNRLLGQKKYEISNHLGNVLAVVSDKEVDVPLNPITASSTSPEPLLEKKSGLYAAYDYYPFGMLMPDRFIQNEAPQCVWVSKNLYVKHLIDSWLLNLNDEADAAHFGPVGTTTMIYQPNSSEGNPGYISLTTTEPEMEVGVNVDLGTTAANKSIQVQFEVVTNGSNHMTMDLVQFNPLTAADEVLASYEVPADRQENFTVQAITVNNKPLRALLRSDGAGENSFRVHQARFTVVDEQIEPTLVEICNTDDFDSDYRFGFNGQEKDNEIAGIGNSMTATFWQYDTRLGRRWNVDPVVKTFESSYATFGGNPILHVDPNGDDWKSNRDRLRGEKLKSKADDKRTLQQGNMKKYEGLLKNENNPTKIAEYELKIEIADRKINLLNEFMEGIDAMGEKGGFLYTFDDYKNPGDDVSPGNDWSSTEKRHGHREMSWSKSEEGRTIIHMPYNDATTSAKGLTVHETLHGTQVTSGLMKPDYKGSNTKFIGNHLGIEKRAYQLQYIMHKSSLPSPFSKKTKYLGITEEKVRNVISNDGYQPYKKAPTSFEYHFQQLPSIRLHTPKLNR